MEIGMNSSEREAKSRELLELDTAFLNAVLQHDVTFVANMLPDDFLSIFPNGRVADKTAELENVRTVELESY
jgi:ketosteroid isomerase-like protein